jgi:hypothetical protein
MNMRNQLLLRELAPGKKTEVWRIYCPELFGEQYVLVTDRGWKSAKNYLFKGDYQMGKIRYSETHLGFADRALVQPWSFRPDAPVYCMEGRNASILCVLRDVVEHNHAVDNPEPVSNIRSLAYYRSIRRK